MLHQYIERETGRIITEKLYGDKIVKLLYSPKNENKNIIFKALTSSRFSKLLAFINYDSKIGNTLAGGEKFLRKMKIDLNECLDPPEKLNTARKIFERKIKYKEFRTMNEDPFEVVSPSDSRILIGSTDENSFFFLKEKFFNYNEMLEKEQWITAFEHGENALFRLTPDKYHYNHCPVSGIVEDFYEINGLYHSCNPQAVISVVTPYSKNKRIVTIIDTDVEGGTEIGYVAMVEVVALMIGEIVQSYSEEEYNNPQKMEKGLFLKKGQPKSLFRPGSSTVVLFFQKNRMKFYDDLISNQNRTDIKSRYSLGFGMQIVETDVKVRSGIGKKIFI